MCSVWLAIPSKRPPEEAEKCLKLWRERGYKIALWVDDAPPLPTCDFFICGAAAGIHYPGYSQAVNQLVNNVLSRYADCDWIVTGGDDVEPDANHSAEEIAWQCSSYFYGLSDHEHETFGVMQPTGDRYGEAAGSIRTYGADRAAYADRVCGSPWIGREFALRINQGKGPLWPEYTHMFEDEELQEVAVKYGVLWQRRDLIQYHRHWARPRADVADMPPWLKEVSGPEHWRKYSAIFKARQAAGFPGSEPL